MNEILYDNFVILSDGKRMAFVMPEKPIRVYLFKVVFPTCLSFNTICERVDISCLDSERRHYIPSLIHQKVTIELDISGPITSGGEELLKGFTPIDSLSIEGLLEVIQERIQERG